jgi:dihydrofolate reductase
MTALVLKISVSLDGFTAPADGSGAWAMAGGSADSAAWNVAALRGASAHLMGATTYTAMAAHWPTSDSPFAAPMNEIPKVVFSNTLTAADATWPESTIATGDLAAAVAELKNGDAEGYLLAHGGSAFARALVGTGLVDEYRLAVRPVVLGGGQPLFTAPLDLEPVSTTAFDGGAVVHVLRPRG